MKCVLLPPLAPLVLVILILAAQLASLSHSPLASLDEEVASVREINPRIRLPVVVRVKHSRSRPNNRRETPVAGFSYGIFSALGIKLPHGFHQRVTLPSCLELSLGCEEASSKYTFKGGTDQVKLVPDSDMYLHAPYQVLLPSSIVASGASERATRRKIRKVPRTMILYASAVNQCNEDFGTARFQELLRTFGGLVLTPSPPTGSPHLHEDHKLVSGSPESEIFLLHVKDVVHSFLATNHARYLVKALAQTRILQHVRPAVLRQLVESSLSSGKACTDAQRALLKVFHFMLLRLHMASCWEPPTMLQPNDIAQVKDAPVPGTNIILCKLFSTTSFLQTASNCMIAENLPLIPTALLRLVLEAHSAVASLFCTEVIDRYYKAELVSQVQTDSGISAKIPALGQTSTRNTDPPEIPKGHAQREEVDLLLEVFGCSLTILHESQKLLKKLPSIWTAIVIREDLQTMYDRRLLTLCRPLIFLLIKNYSKYQVHEVTRHLIKKHSISDRLLRHLFIATQLAHTEDFDASEAIIKVETLQTMTPKKSKRFAHALEWYLRLFQFSPSQASDPFLRHLVSCIKVFCEHLMRSRTATPLTFGTVKPVLIFRDLTQLLAIWEESNKRSLI